METVEHEAARQFDPDQGLEQSDSYDKYLAGRCMWIVWRSSESVYNSFHSAVVFTPGEIDRSEIVAD
jgi:hypothetical protein